MSTLGDTKMHVGVIMSTLGVFSTLEGYHEYTGGCSVHWRGTMSTLGHFGMNEKRLLPNFQDFCSRTFCYYAVVYVDL